MPFHSSSVRTISNCSSLWAPPAMVLSFDDPQAPITTAIMTAAGIKMTRLVTLLTK